MSSVGAVRANLFAIKEETTTGDYIPPSAGADFIPLRPGNETTFEPELLESDELLNDIGATKSAVGKEVVSGTHSAYVKHSGVEGQEPEIGLLYESLMGLKVIALTEYDTAAGSTVTAIQLPVGEGVNFIVGQSLLIKDSTNGYSIRNITSIVSDLLNLNFALTAAPAAGVNLGKAVTYVPAASDHPTFSTTKYIANGHAIETSAGNTVTEASFTMDANGFMEVEFSYEGTDYKFNPILITSTTKYLDFTDDAGTWAISVPEGYYKTPIELADAIESAMNNISTEDFSVTYSSVTGKFTISTSTSAVLSLLWFTGTNAANTIGTKIGFVVSANDTGATTYTSDNAQTYAAPFTPVYDADNKIIVKGAELMIGTQTDNICFCAQTVALTIGKEVEDVDCICEESGILEKIAVSRSAEMEIVAVLKKYDVAILDALLKNEGISAMMNAGSKVGGNWVGGKCFNNYLQNCTVSKFTVSGESFAQVNITLNGFVTSTTKDIYLNFV